MFRKIFLIGFLCLCCTSQVFADNSNFWTNPGVGDWMNSNNWSAGHVPLPPTDPGNYESAIINNGGTARVATGTTVECYTFYLGVNAGDKGTLQISGPGTQLVLNWQGSIGSYGEGLLEITNGARMISNDYVVGLGGNATGVGVANISGAGSLLQCRELSLGYFGYGEMNVSQGGAVTGPTAYVGVYVANGGPGKGLVNLSGTGTTWTFDQTNISYGKGPGTFNVSGGATATGAFDTGAGGNGTLSITDAGSLVNMTGTSYVGHYAGSNGTVNVTKGGRLQTQTLNLGYDYQTAVGAVNISGANSRWDAGDLNVGVKGTGTVTIEKGATMVSERSTVLATTRLGGNNTGSGTITVKDAGSTWTSNDVYVGDSGQGTLSIENGGKVTGSSYYIGNANLANGTVTVTGKGSQLTVNAMTVGVGRPGTLNIFDGGTVVLPTMSPQSLLTIAQNGSSSGSVNIRGASTLSADMIVAGSGSASFNITGSRATINANNYNSTGTGTLYTNYRVDGDGVSTIHVSGTADVSRVPIQVNGNTGFQAMRTDHWDLISAGSVTGTTTVANNTVFQNLYQTRVQDSGKAIVRLEYTSSTPVWDMDDVYKYRFTDTNGLVSGSLRVEGEYTWLAAIFKGLDSVAVAQQLADYLNSQMETGLSFSVYNSNSLLLTGNYLSDYDSGYGYFGWDLSGFNKDYSANVTLLGFNVVPEPGTWAMMLFGLAGLTGMIRRRERKRMSAE